MEALQTMESFAGLSASDYANPQLALEKFWSRLSLANANDVMMFFLQLGAYLVDVGRHEHATQLLELDIGLRCGDYSDRGLISRRFRERLRDVPPDLSALYAIRLATVLDHEDRSTDEIAVLEYLFNLAPGDYFHSERLARSMSEAPEVVLDLAGPLLLVAALQRTSRITESLNVLAALTGMNADDLANPETLRSRVREFLGEKPSMARRMLLPLMFRSLLNSGRGNEGLSFLEASMDLRPEDYETISSLARRLNEYLGDLPPGEAVLIMTSFLGALIRQRRAHHAFAILQAFENFEPSDFDDSERFRAHLRERARFLPFHVAAFYFSTMATALAFSGHSRAAITALEADTELEALDWQDLSKLAVALKRRIGDTTAVTETLYVGGMLIALLMAGQKERAALLVDAYFRGLASLTHREPSLAPTVGALAQSWLDWWGRDATREPLKVCAGLVMYLRRSLAEHGVTLQDREHFIREVGELRRRIVQTGLYWAARETEPARAEEIRRTVLLWDLELAQRLLVERFLLSEIRAVPIGNPPVTGVWPLPEGEQPVTPGHLPDSSEILAAAGILDKADSVDGAGPISRAL